MRIRKVLVLIPMEPEHLALLKAAAPEAEIIRARVKELTPEQVAQADVILGNLPQRFFPHMQQARLMQLGSAGVGEDYLQLQHSHPELVLCCASGAYGVAISEHMLGALLMLMKRLHQYRDQQHKRAWESMGKVRSPRGMKVLALGMGDIGTRFAQLMAQLGAEVKGIRRRPAEPPEGVQEVAGMDRLDELLPWADVVAMSLPDTPDTRRVMDAARFGLMKEGSYLLNVGRGSAVDQEALLEALKSGRLAGASIDVTEPEPLPADHPLWAQENLLITPHISGQFHLKRTQDTIFEIAAHNMQALPDGPFRSRVDYQAGYRS